MSKTSLLGHGKVSLCKNILGKRIFALSRENFEIRIVFSTPRQKSRAEFQIEVKTATKYLLCPLLAKLAHLLSHLEYDALADVAEKILQWRSDFQSGSRVLEIVLWPFSYPIYGIQCDFMQ